MNSIIKTSVLIGLGYLSESVLRNYFPSYYDKLKIKLLFFGIKSYSRFQIYYNKGKLIVLPLYIRFKHQIFGEPKLDRPFSELCFYATDHNLLSEYSISPELLPVKLNDKGEYEQFNSDKLQLYIQNIEPFSYAYYVIVNKNNEMEDIIVRNYENRFQLENIVYSKSEFLVIEIYAQNNKSQLKLVTPDTKKKL